MNGCVVCHRPLHPVTVNAVDVEGCIAGHGVWLDADELTRAFRLDLVDRAIEEICQSDEAAGAGGHLSDRLCPGCDRPLNVLQVDTIEVDRCCRCRGIWLDKGELGGMYAIEGMLRDEMMQAMLRTALVERGPSILLQFSRAGRVDRATEKGKPPVR